MQSNDPTYTRRSVIRKSGVAAAGVAGLGTVGTASASHWELGDRIVVDGTGGTINVYDLPSLNSEVVDEAVGGRNTGEVISRSSSGVYMLMINWEQYNVETGWVRASQVRKI